MDRKKTVRGKMKRSNEKLKYSGREGKDKKIEQKTQQEKRRKKKLRMSDTGEMMKKTLFGKQRGKENEGVSGTTGGNGKKN